MAKVDIGQLSPDAVPRVRGRFLVRPWRGIWVAAKWPRKRGSSQHPNSVWTAQQWAYAARWSANPLPLDYATAVAMVEGTEWMPRDLLMRAYFGKAYEVVSPDGTVWTTNSHSPPPPRRPAVTQWQFNCFDQVDDTSTSTSAFAFKGQIFVARATGTITASMARFTPVNGANYKMVLAVLDGSDVIQSIVSSTIQTIAGTERRWREFDLTAPITNGVRYCLMIGRTDGGNTYVLPLQVNINQRFQWPMSNVSIARLAQQTPAIGHTINNNSNNPQTSPLGILLDY